MRDRRNVGLSRQLRAHPAQRDRELQLVVRPPELRLRPGQKGDLSGKIKGKLNAARTSGTGTWSLNVVVHDAATGAVVDNCQSGKVTWKVKQ
jgi:hypothetical protein